MGDSKRWLRTILNASPARMYCLHCGRNERKRPSKNRREAGVAPFLRRFGAAFPPAAVARAVSVWPDSRSAALYFVRSYPSLRKNAPDNPDAMLHVDRTRPAPIKHHDGVIESDIVVPAIGSFFELPHHVIREITDRAAHHGGSRAREQLGSAAPDCASTPSAAPAASIWAFDSSTHAPSR